MENLIEVFNARVFIFLKNARSLSYKLNNNKILNQKFDIQ